MTNTTRHDKLIGYTRRTRLKLGDNVGYSTSPERVKANRDLLDLIALHVREDRPLEITPTEGLSKTQYQVHELLASAQEFPETDYDADLRSHVRVKIDRAEGKILVVPQTARLDSHSATAIGHIMNNIQAVDQLRTTNKQALIIEWAVEYDKKDEAQGFLNATQMLGWQCKLKGENDKHGRHFMQWQCERTGTPQTPDDHIPEDRNKGAFDLLSSDE